MFEVGQFVVCQGHGVGKIVSIEKQQVGAHALEFYMIKVVNSGMTVMVPVKGRDSVRELINEDEVTELYKYLSEHDIKVKNETWNRRHREYLNKIKTGSVIEIADVLRSLLILKKDSSLSFGEKKMVEQCKELISTEVSISTGLPAKDIEVKIDSCFSGIL